MRRLISLEDIQAFLRDSDETIRQKSQDLNILQKHLQIKNIRIQNTVNILNLKKKALISEIKKSRITGLEQNIKLHSQTIQQLESNYLLERKKIHKKLKRQLENRFYCWSSNFHIISQISAFLDLLDYSMKNLSTLDTEDQDLIYSSFQASKNNTQSIHARFLALRARTQTSIFEKKEIMKSLEASYRQLLEKENHLAKARSSHIKRIKDDEDAFKMQIEESLLQIKRVYKERLKLIQVLNVEHIKSSIATKKQIATLNSSEEESLDLESQLRLSYHILDELKSENEKLKKLVQTYRSQ